MQKDKLEFKTARKNLQCKFHPSICYLLKKTITKVLRVMFLARPWLNDDLDAWIERVKVCFELFLFKADAV